MKPLLDHFGILAPFYERFIPPGIPERMRGLVNMPADGVVLDAGGGTGRVAQFFRGQAAQIVVADQTIKMLREARKKEGIQPLCSYVELMPFKNNTFDRIIMVDALHHVVNQVNTANELWRILKPGGWIVIEEPNILSLGVKFIALIEKLALMRSHFLSPIQIADLFRLHNARAKIEDGGSTAWIVLVKESNKI
jgi:demethylmenaquinone methyltransferase/2-methoxy-6-polyprenyl-1,4-benzoquinol methylase